MGTFVTLDVSFEQEVKNYFVANEIKYLDGSSSFEQLDFTILDKGGQATFHVDVKEKRQKYNLKNWPKFTSEPNSFILDDLTVRKCLAHAPKSGVLIRDNIRERYFFFSVIDLALMPRKRVNRQINRNHAELKGKWLIDLRNGRDAQSLNDSIFQIRYYLRDMDSFLYKTHECYGNYVSEKVGRGGTTRKPSYWDTDIQETR